MAWVNVGVRIVAFYLIIFGFQSKLWFTIPWFVLLVFSVGQWHCREVEWCWRRNMQCLDIRNRWGQR
jgi:hypothetical protein